MSPLRPPCLLLSLLATTMALTTTEHHSTVQAFFSPLQRALPLHVRENIMDQGQDDERASTSRRTTTALGFEDVSLVQEPRHQHEEYLSRLIAKEFDLQTPSEDVLPLQEGQRLVCVGDVHGDVQALRDMLHVAGIIGREDDDDENDEDRDDTTSSSSIRWTGGNTILVQNGDVLDRGDTELACWRLLSQLSHQAVQHGGAVIVLWGNHEAMNCEGQFHYTTGEKEYHQLLSRPDMDRENSPTTDGNRSSQNSRIDSTRRVVGETNTGSFVDMWTIPSRHQPARSATYQPGDGFLVAPLLSKLKVAVRVGRTVCVHAGLTSRHLDDYGGIAGMNRLARSWVLGDNKETSAPPECLVGSGGPVWMRDYSYPADVEALDPVVQRHLDAALFVAGADRMVVGHTVQTEGINAALGGKVWRIDVGASRGVSSGCPEVLEVVKRDGREVLSVLSAKGHFPGAERQARPPGFVERMTQAVTDSVAVPVAEAVLGVEMDK